MKKSYDDILHLPHPVSKNHAQMPIADRAAQFSPFAALTGYEAAVCETARITDAMIDLSEEEKLAISKTLCAACEQQLPLTLTYFEPDLKKQGGAYQNITGIIRRIDTVENIIHFKSGEKLAIAAVTAAALQE